MEQGIIDNLPDILKKNIDTLENTSRDNNNATMTNSQKTAINFDKVKDDYSTINKLNSNKPKSNDTLYISTNNNIHYFIEFKNGRNLKLDDLKLKIYDSLFILSDIKYPDGSQYIYKYKKTNIVDFSKTYIKYILVYNKHYNKRYLKKSNFGLDRFKKFLLKEINTYIKMNLNQNL